ncbi:amino acid adenylation domain-containing protein [Micromonospora echinofusca]|uniref:Amino acid adenylation domain-containing protein n=1 Tax=Micromonospora echinofusca TaxID=47858 RepID=A0ABS3VIT0_MICEH|nr:amino acid adenylation domain-containing protein [Micromonospora echinofusca]MBO4204417.1 amino acid adenylation domain-containing protein [Micromonospora echinofusca]
MDSIYDLFVEASERWPARTALADAAGTLTYGQLRSAATAVGTALKALSDPGDRLVSVRIGHDRYAIIGLLGVLAAGLAYVPVDPEYPPHRRRLLEDDSGARIVLTDRPLSADERPAGMVGPIQIATRPTSVPREIPSDVAYIIYTSGSTGRPKGCLTAHEHLAAFIDSWNATYPTGPGDVWTMFHSLSFDFSVLELWAPLTSGATCVLVPAETARDPVRFIDLLDRERVSIVAQTPTMFGNLRTGLMMLGRSLPRLRMVVVGGEAFRPHDVIGWIEQGLAPNSRIVNAYGPTETTVIVTTSPLSEEHCRRMSPAETPIGRPLPHVHVSVRDSEGRQVDHGTPGELWIAGSSVARGYLDRPKLTEERFVVSDGVRYYRSGDRVVSHDGAEYHFLGRTDDQVKVRGFRIELGEVEAVIADLKGVQAVAAGLETTSHGHQRLIAYVVTDSGDVDAESIRQHLRRRLPAQYHPSRIKRLAQLPVSGSGKLDRAALAGAADLGWNRQ